MPLSSYLTSYILNMFLCISSCPLIGKVIVMTSPSMFSAVILPSCAFTICSEIESPSPLPSLGLVLAASPL